jgi:hypothetical protein
MSMWSCAKGSPFFSDRIQMDAAISEEERASIPVYIKNNSS